MKKSRIYNKIIAFGLSAGLALAALGCTKAADSPVNDTDRPVDDTGEVVGTDAEDGKPESTVVGIGVDFGSGSDDTGTTESGETEEMPILRDCIEIRLGEGTLVGCAVTQSEIQDPKVWEIVTKYFSAVTIGNELKPDALVGYSVTNCPGTTTDTLNGEEIVVPKLDYSRAEFILDKILEWNNENPDRQIKVRGHVLVWHSQTPEWFFHVDYDKNKPYVDSDTMNKRLEWYIKTVLTHFTGEDSKYKGMFYGWDVVNEAISDGTCTYRTDAENASEPLSQDRHGSNSSWWHVYQSNEYIINAFIYANKYAPADLELYYNDYNETNFNKQKGILALLQAVKEQEGEPGVGTRIDAMGMQGHYSMDSPSSTEIEAAIQLYASVVGNVQLTEMDVSASSSYDGSDEAKEEEYEKLRKRYNMIYFAVKNAVLRDDVNITCLTFWGTVDHYSWLQSRSDVGGGSTTGLPQCPLLFDEHYEPKSAYYVFTNTN